VVSGVEATASDRSVLDNEVLRNLGGAVWIGLAVLTMTSTFIPASDGLDEALDDEAVGFGRRQRPGLACIRT
jgi:hypothetical protein